MVRESSLQRRIKNYLIRRGWHVEILSCNAFQKGIPDAYCFKLLDDGTELHRWVDIKVPGKGTLTKAQCQKWPVWESIGLGVWIMTEPDESVLYGPPNFRDLWKPRYDKWLVQAGSDLLLDMDEDATKNYSDQCDGISFDDFG